MPLASPPLVLADRPDDMVLGLVGQAVRWVDWNESRPEVLGQVEAIYTYGHPRVDAALLDRCPQARLVSNYGVGVDHVDLAETARRGIPVGNTPGILDGATADQAWTLLLGTARRLVEGDAFARSPDFTHYDPSRWWGTEVHGSTLGIIGMGRIGRQIARRAVGFDMRTLYYNRRPLAPEIETWGAIYTPLPDLLATVDFLVLACPLTQETRHLIDRQALRMMKASAILINIARGGVVDTEALTEALETRQIAAAGLDVTDPEPLPRDHRMLRLSNVTIAPHLGSATHQTRRKMAEVSVANLLRGLAHEPLLHTVGAAISTGSQDG